MNLTKVTYSVFLKHLAEIPACDNYHDTLVNQSYDYLSQYQFFVEAPRSLMAISPEGNVHVYVTPERKFRTFSIEHDVFRTNPRVIFSFYTNSRIVKELVKDRELNEKPFYYLKCAPLVPVLETEDLSLRLAQEEDQELVNEWYESFNQETGSSWNTPDLASALKNNLYLLFDKGEFVAAIANTLYSETRMWVGRHWVKPEFRNRGFGRKIMGHLEQEALKQGRELALMISSENEKGLSLYRGLGYEEVSQNCFWY